MIIRVMAVDPRPRPNSKHDIVVYQLPEKSREFELLTELFDKARIDWTMIKSERKVK